MKQKIPKFSLLLRLFKYALDYRSYLVLALISMVVYGATKASIALITKEVVFGLKYTEETEENKEDLTSENKSFLQSFLPEKYKIQRSKSFVILIGGAISFIALLLFLSEYGTYYFSGFLVQKVLIDIRCHLCKKMLGMSIAFYNDRKNGDLISRLTNDILVTSMALKLVFGDAVKQGWVLIWCLGGMFYLNWKLTLIVFVVAPILGVLIRKLSKRILRASQRNLENYSALTDAMSQMFSGIRIVKVFHMEDKEMNEFRSISDRLFHTYMKVIKARGLSRAFTSGLSHIALGGAICAGLLLLFKGVVEAEDLAAFLVLVATSYRPLKSLSHAYNDLNEGMGAAHRVFELMDAKPDIEDSPDALDLPDHHSGVRFRHVSFAYNGENVLQDIDFEIPAGKLVAFVGHSGSGKSTMLDLIARFYDPQKGSLEVDGMDLKKVKRASLLDKIAVVTQQTFLFNTTLEENIRYARADATTEEVIEAARLACIDDFIQELPEGYQTIVGEQGVRLSGGQRQRISLARAFLKQAQILILDEATSELDMETERQIQKSLHHVSQGRTTFVVAHRLSTIQGADMILVLDQGRLVEKGTHKELLALNGYYWRLNGLQLSAQND